MKSDQSFFNEFISDINNILDNPFYLLEQKIETLDQDLVSRLKAIHALFFILLSQQRIDERPSKKVAQFLLMMDYCLLELSDRSTIQGSLFIEKFPDCFFDDHCWGEYDPYFITSSRDKNSLGHLFFKIKYNNRQIIDSILKANNFTFYKEIYESGQDNNTPTVETYNQGDDYHQTLTSIYFECKFLKMISNDLSDYFKFVSTKEGLQELLIVLRNNNDFINKNIVPKFLDEKQEAVVKKNVLLIYKWFSNCLHDERIWPELYEFLFELKMPFIDKIGVIFDLNQSIKERFFNKDINQLLIQFVVQKHHQSIIDS